MYVLLKKEEFNDILESVATNPQYEVVAPQVVARSLTVGFIDFPFEFEAVVEKPKEKTLIIYSRVLGERLESGRFAVKVKPDGELDVNRISGEINNNVCEYFNMVYSIALVFTHINKEFKDYDTVNDDESLVISFENGMVNGKILRGKDRPSVLAMDPSGNRKHHVRPNGEHTQFVRL